MPPPKVVYTSEQDLRARFNALRFPEKIRAGKVHIKRLSAHDANPQYGQPPGTRSVMAEYLDGQGHRLALVHFFLKAGSVGASGRHDPKEVREGDTVYKLAVD